MTSLDEPTDVRDTYLRLRQVQRALNEQLFREIGKAGMQTAPVRSASGATES